METEALAPTLDGADSPLPADAALPAPRQVGRFVLLRLLGSGGMGAVYAAYDERLDRRVAIKLLHESHTASDLMRQRVLREAQAMARIADSNVVSIFEVGEAGEQVFIAMEYVEGVTLSRWLRQAPRTFQDVLRCYQAAGQGLRAAHAAGLIHRDFKPDNVLMGPDARPRVADFGLARLDAARPDPVSPVPGAALDRSGSPLVVPLTVAGTISGTPGYMSPEQYRGDEADARSDQFSFCAALYEALYGRLPFAGDTVAALAANTLAGKLVPPPADSPVPSEIHQALVRGLAVEPAARFPSMNELLLALALEQGHTAAGAGVFRRRLVNVVVSWMVLLNALLQMSRARHGFSQQRILVAEGVVFVVGIVCGTLFRRTLLHNRFHRRVYLISTIYLLHNIIFTLFAIHSQIPMIPFVIVKMVLLSGCVMTLALLHFPILLAVPPVIIAAACLLAKFGASVYWLVSARDLIVFGIIAIVWNSAAERAQRELLRS